MYKDGDPKEVMNVVRFQRQLSVVEEVGLLKAEFEDHMRACRPAMETRMLVTHMAHRLAKFGDQVASIGDHKTSHEFLTAVKSLHRKVHDSSNGAPAARELMIVANNFELAA